MKKRIAVTLVILTLIFSVPLAAGTVPKTGRSWDFFNVTAVFNKHWGFIVNPGIRYEFYRSAGQAKKAYMYELFTGPAYFTKIKKFKIIVPLMYYYMGFPNSIKNTYNVVQNVDVRPTIIYTINKKFSIYNKFVFHNTLYANIYKSESQRKGFSTMLKYFLRFQYNLNNKITLALTEDPIFGIVADKEAKGITGIGFTEKGFDMNRLFLGFIYRINKQFSIFPQYCYEVFYKENASGKKELTSTSNYLFIIFAYKFKI